MLVSENSSMFNSIKKICLSKLADNDSITRFEAISIEQLKILNTI